MLKFCVNFISVQCVGQTKYKEEESLLHFWNHFLEKQVDMNSKIGTSLFAFCLLPLVVSSTFLPDDDTTAVYREYLSSEFYLRKAVSESLDETHLLNLLGQFRHVPLDVEAAIRAVPSDDEEEKEEYKFSDSPDSDDDLVPGDSLAWSHAEEGAVEIIGIDSIRTLPDSIATHANLDALRMIKSSFTQQSYVQQKSNSFVENGVIPLYKLLCQVRLHISRDSYASPYQNVADQWLQVLAQVHYRTVLFAFSADKNQRREDDWSFKIVSQFALRLLIDIVEAGARGAGKIQKRLRYDLGPVRIGQVEIPAEVVNEGIRTGWYCVGLFLRCIRGPESTTTTTAVPQTTIDPSVAEKRRAEIKSYLSLVNTGLDGIHSQVQKVRKVKASGEETDLLSSVDELRGVIMEKYTGIVSAALLNEEFTVDLKPTQARFLAMVNLLTPYDPANYADVVQGVETASTLLRQELLQAALNARN